MKTKLPTRVSEAELLSWPESMNKIELRRERRDETMETNVRSRALSFEDLSALRAHLDRRGAGRCQHDLRQTSELLLARGLPVRRVRAWLERRGGYCDCEVLYNVYPDAPRGSDG
jgi:hypothetical protein